MMLSGLMLLDDAEGKDQYGEGGLPAEQNVRVEVI